MKREYLRKSILPSRWGIEVGFNHGHSTALMLGYNPNLSLIAIEPHPDKATYDAAEHLCSVYHRNLEVYYQEPVAVLKELSGKLPMERIEFVHYNVPDRFDPEVFWGFMEWYLCNASVGCRLILSDHTPEIQQVFYKLLFMKRIAKINPGLPDIDDNKQYVKTAQMEADTYQELVSRYSKAADFKKEPFLTEPLGDSVMEEINKLHHLNKELQNARLELERENDALKNEILYLRSLSRRVKHKTLQLARRAKNFLVKKN